jgi:hypothetical protein
VEAVPPSQAGLGSGASNTARYLAAAIGIAIVVAIVTGNGSGPEDGWNHAALITGALNVIGVAVIAIPFLRRRAQGPRA